MCLLVSVTCSRENKGKHPTKPFIQGSEAAECAMEKRNACLFPHCHAASNQAIADSKSGIPPMYLPRQPVISVKLLVTFSACRCICAPGLSNQSPSISFVSERIVFSPLQLACMYHQPLSAIVCIDCVYSVPSQQLPQIPAFSQ